MGNKKLGRTDKKFTDLEPEASDALSKYYFLTLTHIASEYAYHVKAITRFLVLGNAGGIVLLVGFIGTNYSKSEIGGDLADPLILFFMGMVSGVLMHVMNYISFAAKAAELDQYIHGVLANGDNLKLDIGWQPGFFWYLLNAVFALFAVFSLFLGVEDSYGIVKGSSTKTHIASQPIVYTHEDCSCDLCLDEDNKGIDFPQLPPAINSY